MQSHNGWDEFPCSDCGRLVTGIAVGERCAECRKTRTRKVQKIARPVALSGTLLTVVWLVASDAIRVLGWWALLATLVVYALFYTIARRVAWEVLP